MQKYFSKLILIFIILILLVSCDGDCEECTSFPTTPTPTLHPAAVAPMDTIVAWNATCYAGLETVQVLEKTATVASYTLTPIATLTPTITLTPIFTPKPPPKPEKIKKTLNDEFCQAFGIEREITNVKFEPATGGGAYENVIIEMNCEGTEKYCIQPEAFVEFIDMCKNSDYKIDNLFPSYIKTVQLRVFQPSKGEHFQVFFDVNWSDILDYVYDRITPEVFESRVRSSTPSATSP